MVHNSIPAHRHNKNSQGTMIEKPPKISNAMVQRAIKLLSDSKIKETIDSYNDDYLYYSDGEYHPYRYGEKRLRYLGETESWYTFEPRKNISMAIEYFYRFCDPVSIGALMSVRDN